MKILRGLDQFNCTPDSAMYIVQSVLLVVAVVGQILAAQII